MDTSALTSDSVESDNVVAAVSSSAEDRRSSGVGCTSDVKLAENGKITSESIYDNVAPEGSIDANFCTKSTVSCSSSLLASENNPVKSIEDTIIADCHDAHRNDSHVHVDQVSGTDANTDVDDDDDGEIADSRSQTPLQDELEPEADELNQNQAAATSNTDLDPSLIVNQSHDCTVNTATECTAVPKCTAAAVQNSREENGEVSDDDDDDDDDDDNGIAGNQVKADSVHQQLPVHMKSLEKEKPTKDLESQKVLFAVCVTRCSVGVTL